VRLGEALHSVKGYMGFAVLLFGEGRLLAVTMLRSRRLMQIRDFFSSCSRVGRCPRGGCSVAGADVEIRATGSCNADEAEMEWRDYAEALEDVTLLLTKTNTQVCRTTDLGQWKCCQSGVVGR
jgi:hypothetical protein